MREERDSWKNKYQIVEMENAKLEEYFKRESELEAANKKRKSQEDLFSSCIQPVLDILNTSAIPATSDAWKIMVDRIVKEKEKEKEAMESYYKKEIKRIRMKYQPGFGSSSDLIP